MKDKISINGVEIDIANKSFKDIKAELISKLKISAIEADYLLEKSNISSKNNSLDSESQWSVQSSKENFDNLNDFAKFKKDND